MLREVIEREGVPPTGAWMDERAGMGGVEKRKRGLRCGRDQSPINMTCAIASDSEWVIDTSDRRTCMIAARCALVRVAIST